MAGLEELVRPFQTPDVAPPRRAAASGRLAAWGGTQAIALSGVPMASDTLALTFTSTALAGSPVTVEITLDTGDDLADAAAELIAAVNGAAALIDAGVTASAVEGQPWQLTIGQKPALNPQATVTFEAIGATVMTLTGGNVTLTIGADGQAKSFHGSRSGSQTVYVIKYPTEVVDDSLAGEFDFDPFTLDG